MTREELEKIFEEKENDFTIRWTGDNVYQGLQIFAKYIDPIQDDIMQGLDGETVLGPDIDKILGLGLTEEDARKLAGLNWSFDDDNECLSCFV